MIKNLPANAGDAGLIPGSARSLEEGNGNPLQLLLPEKSHGQRSLVGYIPWSRKRVGHDLATKPPPPPKFMLSTVQQREINYTTS